MVRPMLCFVVLCFFAGCKRDWTNVVLEKRLYRDGYYFHVPDKKYTPVQAYVPPVPFPVITGNISVNGGAPDSVPVFYPQPYSPPPVPVYVFIPDTAVNNAGFAAGGNGNGMMNDSLPYGHFAKEIPVKSDSAIDQVLSPQDTTHLIVLQDSMFVDTIDLFTVYGKYKERRKINGEADGFFQLGMIAGPESYGYPVKLNSFSAAFGMRYKIKAGGWNKLVFDLGYRYQRFTIGQNEPKVFPLNSGTHDRERIAIHNFTMGFSNRVLYHRAEEKPVYWLDLGVYGDASFYTNDVYVDVTADESSPIADITEVTTMNKHLNYLQKFNYGVTVRAGFNHYSCFAMYRLSDLMKNSAENKGDLPRIVVGVELSFGEYAD